MISVPQPICAEHDCTSFACGKPALDAYLKERALKNEGKYARTYVVSEARQVVGYYTLSTGAVQRRALPGHLRRNAPEPVPVILLARLAVDNRHKNRRIGSGLLKDALLRVLQVSTIAGCRAVLVHAMDTEAVKFYSRFGFIEFPGGAKTMFLPIATIGRAL